MRAGPQPHDHNILIIGALGDTSHLSKWVCFFLCYFESGNDLLFQGLIWHSWHLLSKPLGTEYLQSSSLLDGVLQILMDLFLRKQRQKEQRNKTQESPFGPWIGLWHANHIYTPRVQKMSILSSDSWFISMHPGLLPEPPPLGVTRCGKALTSGILPAVFFHLVSSALHPFFSDP